MSFAIQEEQRDREEVKKAEQAYAYAKEKADELRKQLAQADQTVKLMREKRNEKLQWAEQRACKRRKDGLIVVSSCYGD